MSHKKIFIWLLAILILGALLRFYKLGEQPFITDEFLDINSSYGYFKTGEWLAWDFNLDQVSENLYAQREERSWIYRIQVAQVFYWFSPTEAAARSLSVIWGLASIVILYLAAAYFTKNKAVGLISAFLFSVSIAGITFDRMLRMYAMFLPVFLLFSWFLFRFFEEAYRGKIKFIESIQKKTRVNLIWALPAAAAGIASYYIHPLALNVGAIIGLYLLVQAIIAFYQKRKTFNKYPVYLLLITAGAVILYISNPKIYSSYANRNPILMHEGNWKYLTAVVSDFSHYILAYGLIVFGFLAIWKNPKITKEVIWIASCFTAVLFSATFLWNESYGLRFIFFAMPFAIILVASGIYYLADSAGKYFFKNQKKVFAATLAGLLLIIPNYAYLFSENSPYRQNEEKADYRAAFKYFLENYKPSDVLIARNFRSFYYQNAGVKVVNKEWKKKIGLKDIEKIFSENPSGWIVSGDIKGDMEKEAIGFMEDKSAVKKEIGGVKIYHWNKKMQFE